MEPRNRGCLQKQNKMPVIQGSPTPPTQTAGGSILGGVSAALPIVGSVISGISTAITNKKNRSWQEKMYKWQRRDALEDWNQQNAYNSPEQQMQRLKEAGLNPNLVYGQGATAVSTSMPRTSNPGSYHAENPVQNAGLSEGLGFATDMALKQQQLRNMKAAEAAIRSGIVNKDTDTALKSVGIDNQQLKLAVDSYLSENVKIQSDIKNQIMGLQRDTLGFNLRKGQLEYDYGQATFNDRVGKVHQDLLNAKQDNAMKVYANARAEAANQRADATTVADLKIKAMTLATMALQNARTSTQTQFIQQSIENLKGAKSLQDIDLIMKQAGTWWNDPWLSRQAVRLGNLK